MAELWKVEDSLDLYGINRWGRDYFSANRKGQLLIRPSSTAQNFANVKEIVDSLRDQGIQTPLLLRFPQLIADRIQRQYLAFEKARKDYGYKGRLRAVFPMKVNQEKEVIEDIFEAGAEYDYGIEVGSTPELLAAVAMKQNNRSLLICNGFKDYEFIELACLASLWRKNVILVIDKLDEVDMIIEAVGATKARPMIGIRMKLYTRGGGKWAESGGERAKFGLSVPAILEAVERLKKAKMLPLVKMVHYHIGSQISDVKKITNGIREAARLYCELVKLRVPLRYLDVGGGMGVDYDGTQSSSSMSVNYDMTEYANAVTYTIKTICDDEGVAHPEIITEAGRAITAYHSMLVAELIQKSPLSIDPAEIRVRDDDPLPVIELKESFDTIGPRNYLEEYHDAMTHREDLMSLFNLGQIDIETRARGELLFRAVCRKALKFMKREEKQEDIEEELSDVKKILGHKYVMNYSLFQSTPDLWGINQLFPIAPIHRLEEEPKETGTLVDLTCDSDGEVKEFIDYRGTKDVLELHHPNGEPYYLGFFLLGAYQDVLANTHNLYGPTNEAFVTMARDGEWKVTKIVRGSTSQDMLEHMNWQPRDLMQTVEKLVVDSKEPAQVAAGKDFLRRFRRALTGYVYLHTGSNGAKRRRAERKAAGNV